VLEGHLRAKEVFQDPPASLPYQERIGHRLTRDQETLTWRIWTDYVREDLKEKNIQKLPGLVKRPKNKQKGSLEVSCESLIVDTADGREERRRM